MQNLYLVLSLTLIQLGESIIEAIFTSGILEKVCWAPQSNSWDEWPLPKWCEYHFPPYFVVYTCWCHSFVFLPVFLVISFRWHYLSLSPMCHPVCYFLHYLIARLFHSSTVPNIFPLWILAFLISFPSVSCNSDPSFLLPSLLLIDGLAMSHPSSFL